MSWIDDFRANIIAVNCETLEESDDFFASVRGCRYYMVHGTKSHNKC
jgi:hypothetical protein